MRAMDAAEAMFNEQINEIRMAGYLIRPGFWEQRGEVELRMLELARLRLVALATGEKGEAVRLLGELRDLVNQQLDAG